MCWKVARSSVEVDVTSYVTTALVRAREVDQADALVKVDPKVVDGAPVFAGGRVLIDIVRGFLDGGVELQRLRTPMHSSRRRTWRLRASGARSIRAADGLAAWPRGSRPSSYAAPGSCGAQRHDSWNCSSTRTAPSPELAHMAVAAGHVESTCVRAAAGPAPRTGG